VVYVIPAKCLALNARSQNNTRRHPPPKQTPAAKAAGVPQFLEKPI